jgi:hypothetical protein
MAAAIVTLADAVVAALNANAFTAPYASLGAVRHYSPTFDLKDFETLSVQVIPRGLATPGVATRGKARQVDYQIDVGIFKRVADLTTATVDPLMLLVEEVADFLFRTALASGNPPSVGVANEPIFDPESLDQMKLFQSGITATYRGYR